MKLITNPQKIEETLTQRVKQVLPTKKGLKELMKKRKIKLYLGIDPTGKKLHLGHTIALRKLEEFANLGHEVILLVGTGTVLAGDPSERDKARPKITEKEIKENMKTWKKQAQKIIDFSKVKIKYNGDWLLKLKLEDIINIASQISAVKLFQRDMFKKRLQKKDTVWMHETLYPLLQGYDSVAMDVDLEIGGTDQTFNMLIGRELLQKMKKKEKFVLITPMILGIDGRQMSKTSGNCIWLTDSAPEMFGKIMSIPDKLIIPYFELLTNLSFSLIKKYKKNLVKKKINPRDLKKKLALEVVKMYHPQKATKEAQEEFSRVFEEKRAPFKMPEVKILKKELNILELLMKTKLASSKSEAKRLILQKAIKIDGLPESDWKKTIRIQKGMILQVGKRKFVTIK